MRRVTGFLALLAILFGLAGASADTVTQYLTFQAQNQRLWHSGPNVSTSSNARSGGTSCCRQRLWP